ncbi:MAG: site-2 protease family protein [Clostridiales bacterium]
MINFAFSDLLFILPAIIISLSFHEFSHAFSAYQLGDSTAKNAGRLSLNPLRHIDPIGLLALMFFRFGWAKPVPVNPYQFRNVDEKTGMLLTALAGPMSNVLLCFIGVGVFTFIPDYFLYTMPWLYRFLVYFCSINASLAFFNLIPVPPLDGSKILFGLLPDRFYHGAQVVEQYGFVILLLLIFGNVPSRIIGPLSNGLVNSFVKLFSLFN